jgi:hypothetical protein
VEFEHFFDFTTLAALAPASGSASPVYSLPLNIDPDAEFHWRGVKVDHLLSLNVGIRFRDTLGNYLSDDFVPVWLAFISPSLTAYTGAQSCIHEPEIVCPASSVILLDVCSYDTVPWSSGGLDSILLTGVKRYSNTSCECGEVCQAAGVSHG